MRANENNQYITRVAATGLRGVNEVISNLGDVDSLLICGPGEARTELKKRMDTKSKSGPEVTLKTADNTTEPQHVAMSRQHFSSWQNRFSSRQTMAPM